MCLLWLAKMIAFTHATVIDPVTGTTEPDMTIVVSGDASVIRNWQKAAEPGRVIPSIGISSSKEMTVLAFTDSLSSGFYKVMGEVAPQYQGMSPSDPLLTISKAF